MADIEQPAARSPFAHLIAALPVKDGILVGEPVNYGLATVHGRKPEGARAIAIGPETWLALEDGAGTALAKRLGARDQSGGYVALRLGGARVRDLLAKGVFLDLDAFRPGEAAATVLAHMSVILWLRDDGETFELLCFRSYASSLWTWLIEESAEYGLSRLP